MKPHILFVDDEETLCDLLTRYFGHVGYDVTVAVAADQAVALIDAMQFHAIVLDLNLGESSGLDVLRFAKKKFPNLPVIIYTGHDMDELLVKKCLADHADGFIRKTDGLGRLLSEVRRHLPGT